MKRTPILMTLCFLLIACEQNKKSTTTFIDESLFDTYSLKIPSMLTKEQDGYWSTPSYQDNIFQLSISYVAKDNSKLQDILQDLVNTDTREVAMNKSLVKMEDLKIENFTGVYAEYEKNHNKGIVPVMTYFSFAVIQDGPDVLKVSALSFRKDDIRDVLTTIKSIRKLNVDTVNDTTSSSQLNELGKSEPSVNLEKARQEGFQVFETDKFMIKCGCQLKVNSRFIKMAKEQGNKYPISAYIGIENENSYETGVLININIYDLSQDYYKMATSKHKLFDEEYLESYAENLKASGINYIEKQYLGVNAIEYNFDQMGLPTKAIIFVKNKRSYMIQIGTRKNLMTKFTSFTDSFQHLIN